MISLLIGIDGGGIGGSSAIARPGRASDQRVRASTEFDNMTSAPRGCAFAPARSSKVKAPRRRRKIDAVRSE
jgi:hypothetical protein